ncbi:MAG TPA: biotin/lipoate A/B protein ligase family protein [Caulifigura sp.]|jgi:lipoate-protein ligase A|nr:biotin/lipoate A/B protein ligase family protein [Caulifigura sp.]
MLEVIVEQSARSGAENMGIDESQLNSAIADGASTLRLYRWNEPTVSLGYFQKETDPVLASRFAGLPRVRRLSGGGALLHHRELTYSIALPDGNPLADAPTELYDRVHAALVKLINERGAEARVRGERFTEPEPFLCFGRGDPRDVVLAGFKIVGSAQRRRKGAILQHGALLLEKSPHAPEFPGLFDLAPATRGPDGEWMEAIAERLRDVIVGASGGREPNADLIRGPAPS